MVFASFPTSESNEGERGWCDDEDAGPNGNTSGPEQIELVPPPYFPQGAFERAVGVDENAQQGSLDDDDLRAPGSPAYTETDNSTRRGTPPVGVEDADGL